MSGQDERALLELLDGLVYRAAVRQYLEAVAQRLDAHLESHPQESMAWQPISLGLYGRELPSVIRSSWVFVLQSNAASGAERHPNSIQRMMALRGRGIMQTKDRLDDQWLSHVLHSEPHRPLVDRWLTIPANVWHQADVPNQNWAVVSFHTAPAAELIEERPDPRNSKRLLRTNYIAMPNDKRETRT